MKKLTKADKLIKEFPTLFPEGFQIECGDGWVELIRLVCNCFTLKLSEKEVKDIKFAQIKEKFGLLRIYFDAKFPKSADNKVFNELHTIISTMEGVSSIVCEDCGQIRNGKFNVGMKVLSGWIMTKCDDCYKKRKKERNER